MEREGGGGGEVRRVEGGGGGGGGMRQTGTKGERVNQSANANIRCVGHN